jgi:hypothetical protein
MGKGPEELGKLHYLCGGHRITRRNPKKKNITFFFKEDYILVLETSLNLLY